MLTLDQVRAVNDGFKSGDLNAALRPLEETVDLRVNELPRLDKAALSALKSGLQNGEDASTWAEALFHPNISVRRFARKTFMGLGDEATPLFESLRQHVERFWSEVPPLPETNKPREAALRREQREMVEGALELLLRSNPEGFLNFYANLTDVAPRKMDSADAIQEWHKRNGAAWEATQAEINRILEEEWGTEWLASDKRWKLPSRVLREINERARQKPEVVQLWNELGDNPYERVSLEWQPLAMMKATMGGYFSDYGATAPTRRVAERMRPIIWGWLQAAFDAGNSPEEQRQNARRILNDNGWWGLAQWLGNERLKSELPSLLRETKKSLLPSVNQILGVEEGLYQAPDTDETVLGRLWLALLWTLGRALQMPYGTEPKDWSLPEGVEASTLRELMAGLEANKANSHLFSDLKTAADNVEKARQAQQSDQPVANVEPEVEPAFRSNGYMSLYAPLGDSVLSPYEALFNEQIQEIYKSVPSTMDADEVQEKVNAAVKNVESEMADIVDVDEKIKLLIEPPAHPRNPNKIISRIPYWKVWSRDLGDNGAQKLRDALWDRAEPKLWARLEELLEKYRRAETDPVEPKIEQKLTEREIKEWKAQTRRDKRTRIMQDIQDLAHLLILNDGIPAHRKVIELADRPSCRDVREHYELQLFAELERSPGDNRHDAAQNTSLSWDKWRLGDEWDVTLARMEEYLADSKLNEWQRRNIERQLATGFYRRGNFDKFKHYAQMPGVFPRVVADAVIPYDDFEAWCVLLNGVSQWESDHLVKYWQVQCADPARKERAIKAVVETVSILSDERVAKALLNWLDKVSAEEMAPHVDLWMHALESSVPAVRRHAMSVLGSLETADFDRQSAAQTASESLWSESGALAKDAAKFLSQLGASDAEAAETAWELLCDATALDNMAVNEAVFRSLSQLKAKHKNLEFPDSAREKLDDLVAVHSDRFAKFQKKLS